MRLLSNALVNKKKKKENLKTKILLEVIEDIIIKYPNTYDFTQQKLNEKCNREGILTDKSFFFFFLICLEANEASHLLKSVYTISRFKSAICLIKILKGA